MGLRLSPVESLLLLFTLLYAVVSRVPLVLLPIYMHDELHFSYLLTGVVDALISVGRLVGAHVAGMHAGLMTIVSGMLCGILAWVLILQFDQRFVFIIACFVVGLTEVVTGVDVMLKVESLLLKRPPEETQMIFRVQLIATTAGVVIAYLGGGVTFWFLGVRVLGFVNMAILGSSLILLLLVSRQRKVYSRAFVRIGHIQEELDDLDVKRDSELSGAASSTKSRFSRLSFGFAPASPEPRPSATSHSSAINSNSGAEGPDAEQTTESRPRRFRSTLRCSSGGPPLPLTDVVNFTSIERLTVVETDPQCKAADDPTPANLKNSDPLAKRSFLAVVVCCFFFTTFGISTQFAICVVYWNAVWDKGSHISGSFMAAGETCGMLILAVLTHPKVFNSRFTSYSGKPANVIKTTALMAILAFVTAQDSIVACAIGTMGIHVCNVLIHSFQAEMIGSCTKADDFPRWIARAYVVKRLANTLGVFNALAAFGTLGPQTSYYAVGSGLAVYAVITGTVCWWLGVLPHQRRRVPASQPQKEGAGTAAATATKASITESLASVEEKEEPETPETEAPVTPVTPSQRVEEHQGGQGPQVNEGEGSASTTVSKMSI